MAFGWWNRPRARAQVITSIGAWAANEGERYVKHQVEKQVEENVKEWVPRAKRAAKAVFTGTPSHQRELDAYWKRVHSNPHYGRLVTTGSRASVTPQYFNMPRRGYRRFKKKRSRKAGYYRRPNPRLGYLGLGTRSDLREMKYWGSSEKTIDFVAAPGKTNINWEALADGSGYITLSHGLTAGSGKTNRVGSRIFVHRITIPWQVTYQADDITSMTQHMLTGTFGLALVVNQSTAGVDSDPTQVFSNSSAAEYTPDAMRNPDYTHKYRVIRRFKVTVRNEAPGTSGNNLIGSSKSGRILIHFRKPLMLHFTASPSTVGGMPDNSLALMGCLNMNCNSGAAIPVRAKIGCQPRIYFTD